MRKGIGHEIGKRRVPDHTKTAPRGVKTPQDAPRPRSWSQLGPKRGPKIDPKSIKIRAWEPPRPKTPQDPPPRFQNGPQNGFQIVAKSTSKSIQNSFTTDAKCACKLFLRHAGMQVCRFAGMQVCGYAGMQVCRYVGMQVCKYE